MIAKLPIPRIDPVLPRLRQPMTPVPPGPKEHSPLLLVSHDKNELNILTKCLSDGYHLSAALNERAALQTIATQAVHLVIINAELTGTDGCRLCAHLKSSAHHSHIPVILLVGDDTDRIGCLEAGADACIEKDACRALLTAQVRNLLANRTRIKDYFAHSLFAHMSGHPCSKEDEAFLNRLNDLISAHLRNIDLNVDTLARLMNMSRPTFYRKMKAVSDLTPNELVNTARLNKAAELISTTSYKVFEIAKMVGFHSQSNFGKAFLKQFNVTPTEYQQLLKSQKQRAHA